MRFSRLAGGNGHRSWRHVGARHYSWPSLSAGHCSSNPLRWFFPGLKQFYSHACTNWHLADLQSPRLWRPALGTLVLSRPPGFSPLALCPGNTRHLSLLRPSAPSLQPSVPAKLCLGSSPCTTAWKLSQVTSLTSFVFTSQPSVPFTAWCPVSRKTLFHTFVWIPGCLWQESNRFLVFHPGQWS